MSVIAVREEARLNHLFAWVSEEELMRLLRKTIAAGNDLSRAPLRDMQT